MKKQQNIQNEKHRENNKRYNRSKHGLIGKIYQAQKHSSTKRGHVMPSYTLDELRSAVLAMPLYTTLYNAWVDSEYTKDLRPTLDRDDPMLPYTEDNIVLMTHKENADKELKDRITGNNSKCNKAVKQLTKDSTLVNTYHSIAEATRQTGISGSGITQCCKGSTRYSHAGGFKWKYTD